MQYQIFVENRSASHFVASVIGMQNVSVDGYTELEAISNAKSALSAQLSKGKVVTIDIDESKQVEIKPAISMKHVGILQADPTFDDWVEKLAVIRQSANAIDDEL